MTRLPLPPLTRRAALSGAVALSFLPARPGAAQAASFTVMTVGGTWGDAIRTVIAEPFAARHNLRLVFDNRPNAQQLAVLQATRGAPTVDTIEIGGPRLGQAVSLGLVEPIDPALAPNFTRVYETLRTPHWAARAIAPWVLTYDRRVFNRAEVEARGWDILLDPRARRRVAIPNFGWMGEMWLQSVALARGATAEKPDPAYELARRVMKENGGVIMGSNDQGMRQFSTGEIVVAPFWSGRTLELARRNIPLEFTYPRGWSPYGFGFSVVAGGTRRDLAQRFVDHSLSEEVQLRVARQFSYVPTLQGLAVPDDMPDSRVPEAAFALASNLDYSEVAKHSDRNLERWNREVVG
jgi:putative spermidine/putrescine transport system substrate-binding protein